jgi:glycosyltransferase involved in cell wall biosynthesis
VMTSAADTEGMPGVLVEAGLSGVPVVSTAAAGVSDVVIDGETGFVVESEDPRALAERVRAIVTQPELGAALGARAREHCETSFTIATCADQWRELTRGVAGATPGPSGGSRGERRRHEPSDAGVSEHSAR